MNFRSGLLSSKGFLALLGILALAACQTPTTAAPSPTTRPASTSTATSQPATEAPTPAPTATPPLMPQNTPAQTTSLCSPLQGETLAELNDPDLLKNPFQPPPPGDDGGHFGVDFAYWTRADGSSMLGLPIYSVLDGRVASAIVNRQPYGNALIIETTLDQIDPRWQDLLPVTEYDPGAPLQPATSLTCPAYDFTPPSQSLSLYLLYGHMQFPAELSPGSQVACGQQIGQVGTTGNSVNPHLHFETRIGPSGIKFASMDHYDTAATQEEMRNYCLWRISGAFKPFDPMVLLSIR